jgi:hypothetical protein
MDAGNRMPLLDFFRRGEVGRDVRLQAAQGGIAPRPLEQLAILAHLTNDAEADIRTAAEATLTNIPAAVLAAFLARSEVPADLREFFMRRGIAAGAVPAENDELPLPQEDLPDVDDLAVEPTTEEEKLSMVQRLQGMSVPQKMRVAMKGSREVRAFLIRDPNKLVALAVLSSPKVSDAEVETFARMGSVSEEVLRTIGNTRGWVKNYGVVMGLVKNPKTPLAISLPLLNRMNEGDVRKLTMDRNIPETLRVAVRRKVVENLK